MVIDQTHSAGLQLFIDLLGHVLILLDSNRSGIKPGALHPARLARPQRRPVLHLPEHWPWSDRWLAIWTGVFTHANAPPQPA
ncbi:hypothetical protein CHR55_31965 [Rhodococcus qingshengii]|uniref:Uncharacterized protein n=1 Tax=Rhodococcus qingshengii TaxID=334542 RepID=A0A2A5J0W2_RHOSG|nr:hypothetical protein CHR55_31965 [Rhodococcus qingshengii]